jgi:hypothetical protein
MSIPDNFKSYIDEDTYKDASIALDILIKRKCPLFLLIRYIVEHPSVRKKANPSTLTFISNEIEKYNKIITSINKVGFHYNNNRLITYYSKEESKEVLA